MTRDTVGANKLSSSLVGVFLGCVVAAACSGKLIEQPPVGTVKCTPGSNIGCQCKDGSDATRRCRADGVSYEPCSKGVNVPCPEDVDPNMMMMMMEVDAGNPMLADKCPGASVTIKSGTTIINGETDTAKDDFFGSGACATGKGSPDVVYRLIAQETGNAKITVIPDPDFDTVAYLRTTCTDGSDASQRSCGATGNTGQQEVLNRVPMMVGQEIFLVVDGSAGNANKGGFKVKVEFNSGPFCGDGKISDGEACDDDNFTDGDGCTPGCKSVNGTPDSASNCPGQPVHVWSNQVVTGRGSTKVADFPMLRNRSERPQGGCSYVNTNATADHTYQVIPEANGTMTITLDALTFDAMLVVRDEAACNDTSMSKACSDKPGTEVETLSLPVQKGRALSVTVDGGGGQEGEFTIKFNLRP
jgi:cysteine-rich repeat protein